MATYSFIAVSATISGPGGSFNLGQGSGNSEEGITVSRTDDKNTMTMGADGSGMHSLHAGNPGTVTVRLLKVSPVNQMLMTMYNYQKESPANWGSNIIVIRDVNLTDIHTCRSCAFRRAPDITYAKDGGTVEWVFDAIDVDAVLGSVA